ncbi:MAG: hypothetical protein ACRD20_18660 [Terriglobales bacterium]
MAECIVMPKNAQPSSIEVNGLADEDRIHQSIHALRNRLRDEPRNAIQWVELSRLYTLLGESDRSLRTMMIATALGPDNRFVVRSAARLFLHEHDAARSLRIIRNASGGRSDPWLLAAEIAVASASNSPSLFAKIGSRRNQDSSLSLFDRTELSSALATLELESGSSRRARQLFRSALISPNENSIAQVEWANRQIGSLEIEENLPHVPRSYEAPAHVALATGQWEDAIRHGLNWLGDQPFSKRPAIFTSYITSLVEDYARSIQIIRASLKVNAHDPMLINNLAFALASDNQVAQAVETLRSTDHTSATGLSAVTLAATHGLVLFRTGFPDQGRVLYQIAIEKATGLSAQNYRVMAELYLAREELVANTALAEPTATRALQKALKSDSPEVGVIATQVLRLFKNWSALRGDSGSPQAVEEKE